MIPHQDDSDEVTLLENRSPYWVLRIVLEYFFIFLTKIYMLISRRYWNK